MGDKQPGTGEQGNGSTGSAEGTGTGPADDGRKAATAEPDLAAELAKWKDLARQNEARAKSNADAAQRLAEIEESQKTEQQKLADRLAQAERERDAARLENLRTRIAAEKGLPPELADLLRGTTRDDLEKVADTLLKHLPKQGSGKQRTPTADAVAGGSGQGAGRTPADVFASLIKQGG